MVAKAMNSSARLGGDVCGKPAVRSGDEDESEAGGNAVMTPVLTGDQGRGQTLSRKTAGDPPDIRPIGNPGATLRHPFFGKLLRLYSAVPAQAGYGDKRPL